MNFPTEMMEKVKSWDICKISDGAEETAAEGPAHILRKIYEHNIESNTKLSKMIFNRRNYCQSRKVPGWRQCHWLSSSILLIMFKYKKTCLGYEVQTLILFSNVMNFFSIKTKIPFLPKLFKLWQ